MSADPAGPGGPYGDEPPFRRGRRGPLLERLIPVSRDLRGYGVGSARHDILAGTTVAALAVPAAMAYAELAGLSPVNGLYALLLPAVAYVLLGSSKQLIVGPDGAISTLVAAAILPIVAPASGDAVRLAGMLALLVAICYAAGWILRLGFIADYLSRPVLIGYIHGVAVVLIIGQIGKLLGLPIDADHPLAQLWQAAGKIGQASVTTVAVSAAALAILLLLRLTVPRFPAALLVVSVAITLSWALDLQAHGVAVVGPVPPGLPAFKVPSSSLNDIGHLLPAALGIFLVSFADEILTARTFAGKHNQSVRAPQELIAMGAANAAAGFTQGFSVGASGSRTAVNDDMRARSQISGLIAAITVGLIALFVTGPIQYLPKAVLGAVIIVAAIGLIEPSAWRTLADVDRVEVAIAAVTTACVIGFGVLEAIVIAVGLSVIDVVRRSANPHDAILGWVPSLQRYANISIHRHARVTPHVVVYRLDDRLFFANARYFTARVHEAIRAAPTPTSWLVFDAEAVSHADSTGLEALVALTNNLNGDGVTLVVARLHSEMKEQFRVAGVIEAVGSDHFYPTVQTAVDACSGAKP